MLEQIFGGSPLGVVLRLIVISIIVGVVLHALGLSPLDLFDSIRRLIDWLYTLGFDWVEWIFRYFLLGAVVVIPVWVLYRLLKFLADGGKSGSSR